MATPESNTLLALQLFGRPAQEYQERSDQKLRVLLGIAQANKEMEARRQLAELQASREDARWRAQGEREDARITAADKRQAKANQEKERADIENEIDRGYPLYAKAAQRAGLPVKKRTEFESTRAGLGQLQADYAEAEATFTNKQMGLTADSAIAELDAKRTAVREAEERLRELSMPSEADQKIARSNAVTAVKMAIENGDLESTKKLRKDAISKGLDALARGDQELARGFLGDEALRAFESGYDQTLMTLPNVKARMQQQQQVFQQVQGLKLDLQRTESDFRKVQATNPILAEKLTAARTSQPAPSDGLQQLMGVGGGAGRKPSFGDVTPPKKTGTTAAAGTSNFVAPKAEPDTAYQYPALSVFGAGERAVKNAPSILALPGRAIDAAGRYGAAGLSGLFTGDYSVPEKGLVTMAGEGIGSLIAGDPYARPAPPPPAVVPIDVDAVLAARPAGPWSEAEQRAITARTYSQPQGPSIFQRLFPGAR